MGFATPAQVEEFLRTAPEFEAMLQRAEIQLIKYWFSVSDEEQERRFRARAADPTRRWKLSPVDVASWSRWQDHSRAKDAMFAATDTDHAPWWVVDGEVKRHARLNCISHLLDTIPYQDVTPEPIELLHGRRTTASLGARPANTSATSPPATDGHGGRRRGRPSYAVGPRADGGEVAVVDDQAVATFDPDPDDEPTARERLATLVERRLDVPMAVLAVVWAGLVAYELIAPRDDLGWLAIASNVIWAIFAVELLTKLIVSGHPVRFLRRHWPSVLFLVLPILRILRVTRALRLVRVLPASRVVGSSYRAVGTARGLLAGRLQFLVATTAVVVFGSGQLLYVLERGREGALTSLGDALWWAANLGIAANLVHEPVTSVGRILSVALSTYAIVVFASVAGTVGAFFVESRQERATLEEGDS